MGGTDSMLDGRRKGNSGGFSLFLSAQVAAPVAWIAFRAIRSPENMLNRAEAPLVYFFVFVVF